MNPVSSLSVASQYAQNAASQQSVSRAQNNAKTAENSELRETFDKFVGEVFFGQMMESMRKTVGKPAYMHGGRGEEVFQKQLDQVFSEEMTKASASQFSEPMFELFTLNRQ
ncbi:MAG: rod-binding protein [Pirellulales bacterium]